MACLMPPSPSCAKRRAGGGVMSAIRPLHTFHKRYEKCRLQERMEGELYSIVLPEDLRASSDSFAAPKPTLSFST
jgi:hypothetical protein